MRGSQGLGERTAEQHRIAVPDAGKVAHLAWVMGTWVDPPVHWTSSMGVFCYMRFIPQQNGFKSTSWVTLGKLFYSSRPQYPHL